jgi:hypothetical protein
MVEQYGFVAILDALGVSSYKIDEASNFISEKNKLLSELANEENQLSTLFCSVTDGNSRTPYPQMTVTTFGDSIIVCWPISEEANLKVVFPIVAWWLQKAIALGIKHRILLRGSVSIGRYLVDNTTANTTILGPAIADANAWSQEADWFGTILTPYCQIFLTEILENLGCSVPNAILCVKFPVPLRQNQGIKDLYSISWPLHFLSGRMKGIGLIDLSTQLSALPIPKGVESKFENSINFFKQFENEEYPKISKYMGSLKKAEPKK